MEIKKVIIYFVFLLFTISIIYASTNSTNKLKSGESAEFEGKTIKVVRITSSNVVFDVGGEKQAIKAYEEKQIDGVKIFVNEIFFVEEVEERFVNFDVFELFDYECGNGKCETGEIEKCCKDCGCSSGYKCVDNYCELINTGECSGNDDCDDNNIATLDLCTGTPKKCIHTIVTECKNNQDCDDKNNCTKDECVSNSCYNKKIDNCKQEVDEIKEENKSIENLENKDNLNEEKPSFFKSILTFIKQKLFKLVNL
ncbi:MAG: hypothetical protein V1815_02480 [Candidatus Woesearchaeota archaeon]